MIKTLIDWDLKFVSISTVLKDLLSLHHQMETAFLHINLF